MSEGTTDGVIYNLVEYYVLYIIAQMLYVWGVELFVYYMDDG